VDELKREFGDAKGEFMVKGSRNLCLYPNVYLMDQFSTQIRHYRPIAPDKTEVTIYCIAPKGESAEARAHRIRQYEDFFNASGMATPDDLLLSTSWSRRAGSSPTAGSSGAPAAGARPGLTRSGSVIREGGGLIADGVHRSPRPGGDCWARGPGLAPGGGTRR
jgi:Ring hydroxylating alpha subunit (catalytic domain)